MKTYKKVHSSPKALKSHVSKIKARGGKTTVTGKTVTYKFGENSKKYYKGGKLPKNVYTKEQLLKKFKGKYIHTYPLRYEYRNPKTFDWETVYEVRGVSKTIKENYNLPEDEIIN